MLPIKKKKKNDQIMVNLVSTYIPHSELDYFEAELKHHIISSIQSSICYLSKIRIISKR